MIRAVVNWLRVVWPPGWIVELTVVFCLAMVTLDYWLAWFLGTCDTDWPFAKTRAGVVLALSALYGAYRVYAFHPLLRRGYDAWLALTPWTSAKPLPLGPLHLVWQDAVAMALLYALASDNEKVQRWESPLFLLIAYLLFLGLSFLSIGLKWATYAMAFGFGLAVRLAVHPWAAACVIALVYVALRLAIRQALERFPWQRRGWVEAIRPTTTTSRMTDSSLGWPFSAMRPEPTVTGVSYTDAALLSLLPAWWLYALLSHVTDQPGLPPCDIAPFWGVFGVFCGICVLGRLLTYCISHGPPINFWGRIFTLRWIIPGYDQIFVAPACALLLGNLTFWGLPRLGLPVNLVLPCGVFAVLFVTLAMGPSRRQWLLTGSHRITLWSIRLNRQEFVEL